MVMRVDETNDINSQATKKTSLKLVLCKFWSENARLEISKNSDVLYIGLSYRVSNEYRALPPAMSIGILKHQNIGNG